MAYSILLPGSLIIVTLALTNFDKLKLIKHIIFFQVFPEVTVIPFVAIIPVLISFMIWITTYWLDEVYWEKLDEMDRDLKFRARKEIYNTLKGRRWFMFRSKFLWPLFFAILIVAYVMTGILLSIAA